MAPSRERTLSVSRPNRLGEDGGASRRPGIVDWQFTLALGAYDLIRLPELPRAAA